MSTKLGALYYVNLCIEFIHFQHPVLKLSQSPFFLYSEKPSFKPIKKAKISLVKLQFLVIHTTGQTVQTGLLSKCCVHKNAHTHTHTHTHTYKHADINTHIHHEYIHFTHIHNNIHT